MRIAVLLAAASVSTVRLVSMLYFLCTAATRTTGLSSVTNHRLSFCRRHLVAANQRLSATRSRRLHLRSSSSSLGSSSSRSSLGNSNVISSTQSATVKKIRALLTSRKKRLEYGATVVEGPRPILDLLSNAATRPLVQQILIEQGGEAASSSSSPCAWDTYYPAIMERLGVVDGSNSNAAANAAAPMILPVTSQVMRSLSDTVTPQGIVAIVSIPQFDLAKQQQSSSFPLFLVLDAVSDPGNLGTLLRSCAAVGAAGVILLPGSTDPWNPKALRSSMGCAFYVPLLVQAASWPEARELLTNTMNCRKILAATMLDTNNDSPSTIVNASEYDSTTTTTTASTTFWDVDWTEQAVALIIGNEGNGLCADIRDAIQNRQIESVYVPMQDMVESLNAGVCGSVILFEYLRQCRLKQSTATSTTTSSTITR